MEFDERTKTITLTNKEMINPKSLLGLTSTLSDSKTASTAAKKIHFHTITEKNKIKYHASSTKRRQYKQLLPTISKHYRRSSIKKIDSSMLFKIGMFLMFLGGVLFALYFKTKYPEETTKITKNINILLQNTKKQIENFIEAEDETKTLTSKVKPVQMSIFISSHPSRAKIFIDGVWDYKRTPKQIRFHKGQTVVLKSEGYKDYILSEKDTNKAMLEQNQIFVIFRENKSTSKFREDKSTSK